jgi:hypothetical protein
MQISSDPTVVSDAPLPPQTFVVPPDMARLLAISAEYQIEFVPPLAFQSVPSPNSDAGSGCRADDLS